MNRLLVAISGLLLLASGCTPTEEEKKECQLEAFDLSACDRSGLAAVTADGIWHVNVSLEDGTETPGALRVAAENGLLFGSALTERRTEGETFFLASEWQEPGYVPTRFALAGCQAPAADRVQGEFRRCSGGAADLKGSFEAVRVSRQAGEAEASGVSLVRETALPNGGVGMDVFVANNGYAYVAALTGGLYIIDVSNPTVAPAQEPIRVAANGDSWHQVWVKGETLFVASSREGLIVFDVKDPKAPKRVRAVPLPSVEVWALHVDGDRLYAMSPSPRAEVLIYDIQTPSTPSLLARHVVKGSVPELGESPVGGTVFGNELYIGHWRYGLAVVKVLNVATPNKPEDKGRYRYDKATSRYVAVGRIGGRTIAFEASEGWDSRVRALDVSDPTNIRELASYGLRPASSVLGLTLVGTKLYVAHSLDGLRVLDVSSLGGDGPYQLSHASWYNSWRETDPGRGRFFLEGLSSVKVPGDGYIYATDTSRGLLIFREQG